MYVQKDKWLSMLFQYIWREQISCVILLSSSGTLRTNAVHTHTHTLQPTVPILCQTCQDTWVSGLLYRQTWGQLWQAWGNTRDQLKSKFSPDLTACLFVCLTGARHITLGTIDYNSELIVASVSLEVILLQYFLSQLSLPLFYNWQQHELNLFSAGLAVSRVRGKFVVWFIIIC